MDIDQDGLTDLIVHYSADAVEEIARASDSIDGPISLHYTAEDGDYLVEDIFGIYEKIDVNEARRRAEQDETVVSSKGLGTEESGFSAKSMSTPPTTRLAGISPNPFNPSTTIRFELHQPERVQMIIYNLQGAEVRRLLNRSLSAGSHAVTWNGRDDSGRPVASGTYFMRFVAGERAATRKLALIK
jgi:hypothetical protein